MRRREFLGVLGGAAAAWPLAARAQQPSAALRIGVVSGQPRAGSIFMALEQRMTELGYQLGENFAFEFEQASTVEEFESGYRALAGRNVEVDRVIQVVTIISDLIGQIRDLGFE